MKMIKIQVLCLLTSLLCNPVWADADAMSLNKGQAAPYDGVLLSTDRAQLARKAELELPQYKLLNESFQRSLDLEKNNVQFVTEKNNILVNDNKMLSDALQKERSSSEFIKILYFFGGVALTALAVEGASKLR